MSTERDTHFQRFAQLLWQEIDGEFPDSVHTEMFYAVDDFEANIVQIIAQRAYDLVHHACIQISNDLIKHEIDVHHEALFEAVQDMTKWTDNTDVHHE